MSSFVSSTFTFDLQDRQTEVWQIRDVLNILWWKDYPQDCMLQHSGINVQTRLFNTSTDYEVWHQRLGHAPFRNVEETIQHSVGLEGLVGKKYPKDRKCPSCMIDKSLAFMPYCQRYSEQLSLMINTWVCPSLKSLMTNKHPYAPMPLVEHLVPQIRDNFLMFFKNHCHQWDVLYIIRT